MALVAAALARLPASAAALSLPTASAARAPVAYRCPSCGDPLLPTSSGSLRCRNGHSVDAAREGHHHLLRRPLSAKVAEEADQVARAARAFHDGGSFDAAADAIAAEVVRALLDGPQPAAGRGARRELLAAGCGDGLILRRIERALRQRGSDLGGGGGDGSSSCGGDGGGGGGDGGGDGVCSPAVGLWGVDTAKRAVKAAAKRQPSARFAAASPHALPFSDGCFDLAAALGLRRRSLRV